MVVHRYLELNLLAILMPLLVSNLCIICVFAGPWTRRMPTFETPALESLLGLGLYVGVALSAKGLLPEPRMHIGLSYV